MPSQFTTVIFPDGSQPCPMAVSTILQNQKSKSSEEPQNVSEDSNVELKHTTTTTTTLSRYLYHRRWIWTSGRSRYDKCNSSALQKLQLQLARTLSVLTK